MNRSEDILYTWVTVCSVKGTSSPYKKNNTYTVHKRKTKLWTISARKGSEQSLLWEPHGAQLAVGHSLRSPWRRHKMFNKLLSTQRHQPKVEKKQTNSWRWRFHAVKFCTYPPSTISSTAKKSPSMFSNKALLSTFFLQKKKMYKHKSQLS